MPVIVQADIEDRSKGDALSNGIGILQLVWFVPPACRPLRSESSSEIDTLASAALSCIPYGLWWKKPKDVGHPNREKAREEAGWVHKCRQGRLPAANELISCWALDEGDGLYHFRTSAKIRQEWLMSPLLLSTSRTSTSRRLSSSFHALILYNRPTPSQGGINAREAVSTSASSTHR